MGQTRPTIVSRRVAMAFGVSVCIGIGIYIAQSGDKIRHMEFPPTSEVPPGQSNTRS